MKDEKDSLYYKQGFKAFHADQACAYSPMSVKGELWSMGWFAAQEISESIDEIEDVPEKLTIEDVNDLI